MGRTVERVALPAIKAWAHQVSGVDDLEQLTDELCQVLRDPERAQPAKTPGDGDEAPDGGPIATPNLGDGDPLDHLADAVCLGLQRYLSPAREGDPVLLEDLLHLALRLRVDGARETVAGLLIGGAYRDQEGADGPLDDQMVKVLQACGLGDAERRLLRELTGDGAVAEESEPAEVPLSLPGSGDGEPPAVVPGDQVPQVNDPDQVFAFVDAVKEGVTDRRAYADHARVSIRQADFVARAAAALGLVQVERGGVFQVTELGGDDHGRLGLEAAEAADAIHGGLVAGCESEGADALIKLVPALELVLEEGEVFREDDLVLGGESFGGKDPTDPVEVTNGPMHAVAIYESAPTHELQDVVARFHDLALEGLAAANKVADPLVLLGGDVDKDEPMVAEVTGDLDGVAPISLAMFTRTTRNQRWGGQVAFDAPLGERALEHVASTRGLIADADAALGEQALEVAANLAQIVG